MRLLRRRTKPELAPPVGLPSLDRLAGLIERVVELVDEVAGAPAADSKRHAPASALPSVPVPSSRAVAIFSPPVRPATFE